jgi:hypothetical protein
MAKVESLRDRRSKLFNHLSMVAEGVACLQWVCVDKTPGSLVSDIIPGSELYGNKVMMEYKGKEEVHVSFAKDFKAFLSELQKYIKAHHATGLSWNANGGAGELFVSLLYFESDADARFIRLFLCWRCTGTGTGTQGWWAPRASTTAPTAACWVL